MLWSKTHCFSECHVFFQKRSVLINPRSCANIASVVVRVTGSGWAWLEEVTAKSLSSLLGMEASTEIFRSLSITFVVRLVTTLLIRSNALLVDHVMKLQ